MLGPDEFNSFLNEYFLGVNGEAEYRELFLCRGDPKGDGFRYRSGVKRQNLSSKIKALIFKLEEWNIYMGIGYWKNTLAPRQDIMLYDRFSLDFDNDENPEEAVKAALAFAKSIKDNFGATPLVFKTGFKGAHVIIPLKPAVDWDLYLLLWKKLLKIIEPDWLKMIDLNMLQWNRVDRVPLTYNVKEEGARYCNIIYPEAFTWKTFSWSKLVPLEIKNVGLVKVIGPKVLKTIRLPSKDVKTWGWVSKIVENGLPDGRVRFMLYTLIPYLAVQKHLAEEEVVNVCHIFLENSCRKQGKCEKVYDSWIRGVYRSATSKNFAGFSLTKLEEIDPELYGFIMKVLNNKTTIG